MRSTCTIKLHVVSPGDSVIARDGTSGFHNHTLPSPAPREGKIQPGKCLVCILRANSFPRTALRHWNIIPTSNSTFFLVRCSNTRVGMRYQLHHCGPASPLRPTACKPLKASGLHSHYTPQYSLSLDIFCAVCPIFREQTCFSLLLWTMKQKMTVHKGSWSLEKSQGCSSRAGDQTLLPCCLTSIFSKANSSPPKTRFHF